MGETNTAGESRQVPGKVIFTPLYGTMPDGLALETKEGGWLVFRNSGPWDPDEGVPYISTSFVSAIAPVIDPEGVDGNGFKLTTALVDADGQLWQRSRFISACEIWNQMLYQPEFQTASADIQQNPGKVVRRVLVEPIDTCCDMRDHAFVEIVRKKDIIPNAAEGQTPTEQKRSFWGFKLKNKEEGKPEAAIVQKQPEDSNERLLYCLKFKYFGAKIGIFEDHVESYANKLVVQVQPCVNSDLIVAIDYGGNVLPTKGVSFMDLGTLFSSQVHLKAGWELPSLDKPTRGDIDLWKKAYQEAGRDPVLCAFKRNPGVRYVSALGGKNEN